MVGYAIKKSKGDVVEIDFTHLNIYLIVVILGDFKFKSAYGLQI